MNRKQRRFQARRSRNDGPRRPGAGTGTAAPPRPVGPQQQAKAAALVQAARDAHLSGRFDDAATCYRRLLKILPGDPHISLMLATARVDGGRFDEALAVLEPLAGAFVGRADYHTVLGRALLGAGRSQDGAAAFERALDIDPGHPDAATHLALALGDIGSTEAALARLAEATASLVRAAGLAPDNAEAHRALGTLRIVEGRYEEAIKSLESALAISPDNARARWQRGIARFFLGALGDAWDDFEWRWQTPEGAKNSRPFTQPRWQGEALADKTILVWGDQGLGDEILHAGCVPDLMAAGAMPVIECAPRLVPLFQRSFAGADVVARTDPPAVRTSAPDIAMQAPLAGLGRLLRREADAFAGATPYLKANPDRREALRRRYRERAGETLLVGLSWHSKRAQLGSFKSLGLDDWAPVLRVPGVTFVDLQYGDTAEEVAAARAAHGMAMIEDPSIDPLADMDGFAAQVAALDLVISTSNTTVHVAGGLGVETWTLLSRGPGLLWYWGADGETSLFYPSMRLLRQARPGDWTAPIAAAAAALQARAAG